MSESAAEIQKRLARGPAIWALAGGMTLVYGTLFFNFAGLILVWEQDPGWPRTLLATGPVGAMLLAALLMPLLGRLVDAGWGPELLRAGPVIGALALVALSQVREPLAWIACWLIIGLAQAACFYEVGFAFLIRRLGPAARMAILRVTMVAGLASSIAFPLYATFGASHGWRFVTLVGALVTLAGALPLNWYATRKIRTEAPPPQTRELPPGTIAPAAPGRRAIGLLILVSAGSSINHWMVATYVVPLLIGAGYSKAFAVGAAACLGPAQVLARIGLMWSEGRYDNRVAVRAILILMLLASAAMVTATAGLGFGLVWVMLQGTAFGAMTVLRPVLIADVMGADNYGANAGKILMPTLLAGACAPAIGALVLDHVGATVLVCSAAIFLGIALLALSKLPKGSASG